MSWILFLLLLSTLGFLCIVSFNSHNPTRRPLWPAPSDRQRNYELENYNSLRERGPKARSSDSDISILSSTFKVTPATGSKWNPTNHLIPLTLWLFPTHFAFQHIPKAGLPFFWLNSSLRTYVPTFSSLSWPSSSLKWQWSTLDPTRCLCVAWTPEKCWPQWQVSLRRLAACLPASHSLPFGRHWFAELPGLQAQIKCNYTIYYCIIIIYLGLSKQ